MDGYDQRSVTEARKLVRRLRAGGEVKAPRSLLPAVLARLGLADTYARVATPIGPVFVAYNAAGISAVMRTEDASDFEHRFQQRFGRSVYPAPDLPTDLAQAIREQIAGAHADLHFDLRGLSEFERAVLLKALEIPRGEVRPYAWIAREIGRPKAVRAVGSALAANPIPLLIPCHRVVRSDGRIGAYVFGSQDKRAVLQAEGAEPDLIEALARAGVRYYAHKASGTFCLLTCGGEHRVPDPNRIAYRSEQEALTAGYRPCKDCRPAGPLGAR